MDGLETAYRRHFSAVFRFALSLVRRFGTPREVGQLICFLASRKAAYINGVSIPIDGGTLAWRGTVDQLG